MEVKRGTLVAVSPQGDYGKPRPALIIQSDLFSEHASVTIPRVTSDLRPVDASRMTIEPSKRNGRKSISQVMLD